MWLRADLTAVKTVNFLFLSVLIRFFRIEVNTAALVLSVAAEFSA